MTREYVNCEECEARVSVEDAVDHVWHGEDGETYLHILCPACATKEIKELESKRYLDLEESSHLASHYREYYVTMVGA